MNQAKSLISRKSREKVGSECTPSLHNIAYI